MALSVLNLERNRTFLVSLFKSAGISFQLSIFFSHTEEFPSYFQSAMVHCQVKRVCQVSGGWPSAFSNQVGPCRAWSYAPWPCLPGAVSHPGPLGPAQQTFPRRFFLLNEHHTVKKVIVFPHPQPGCHWPNSPWPGIIKLIPARESLVSDIPTGDGKNDNLFFQCILTARCFFLGRSCLLLSMVLRPV